jgi:hypothetical protein
VWDNEGAVGAWRRGKPRLTHDFQAFRGLLGVRVILLKPRDPESKGIVERANGYLETSFLPGRVFTSPVDFNIQLGEWTALVNQRFRRRLECAPSERVAADRAAMLALPPVEAAQLGWHRQVRLPRDHYVRLDANDYSVHPGVVGRKVDVHAGLERVRVTCEGRLVAEHARCWAAHQSITDPVHAEAAAVLRGEHRRAAAGRAGGRGERAEVQERDLAVYEALCDGDGEGEEVA